MPNSEPITLERLNAKGQHAAALVEQFHAAGKHAVAALNDFAADLLEVLPKHDTPVKHDTPEYPVAIWHPLIEQAEPWRRQSRGTKTRRIRWISTS
jgi:hypothetical protein